MEDNFGKMVCDLRKLKGLTQEELGEKVGLKKSAVAKYENGRIKNISTDVVERFAKALGVHPSYFLGAFDGLLYTLGYILIYENDCVMIADDENKEVMVAFPTREWERIRAERDTKAIVDVLGKAALERGEKTKDPPSEENESLGKSSLLNQIWNEAQGCDDGVLEATIAFMRTLKDHRRE